MKRLALVLGLSLLLAAVAPAYGYVIYTTGGDPNYTIAWGYTVTGPSGSGGEWDSAMEFTTPGTYTSYNLTSIKLPLDHASGSNQVDVMITSDSGGSPGTVLETISVTAPASPGLVTATFAGTTALSASTSYWVRLSAPTDGYSVWLASDPAVSGNRAYSADSGANWYVGKDSTLGAFEVSGTPEPATMGLLAMGALALIRRRR